MATTALPATATTPRFEEKRGLLLGAAAVLFNERGVKGTTLADIGAAVGLVTNSVTYYYRRKDALATACFLRSIEALDALADAAGRHAQAHDRVAGFFSGHAQLLAAIARGEHGELVAFSDIRALPSPQQQAVFAAYTQMFRRVRDLLKDERTERLWSREDFNARAHILLSNAHWVRLWIGRHEVVEYARVAQRVADFMLQGLGGPPTQSALAGLAGQGHGSGWDAQLAAAAKLRSPARSNGDAAQSEAFLRAATVLVNEQGYRGASVDKISARLNVTKGAFYHHNENKHDLIAQCFERSFAVVRCALALAADAPGSGRDRVGAAVSALVRYQLGVHGPLLRFTATSALPDRGQRERVRSTMQQLTERLGGQIVDGMVDGSIRPLDSAIAAQSIMAAVNAAAELHRWLPGAHVGNVVALYVRPLLSGLLCPRTHVALA